MLEGYLFRKAVCGCGHVECELAVKHPRQRKWAMERWPWRLSSRVRIEVQIWESSTWKQQVNSWLWKTHFWKLHLPFHFCSHISYTDPNYLLFGLSKCKNCINKNDRYHCYKVLNGSFESLFSYVHIIRSKYHADHGLLTAI